MGFGDFDTALKARDTLTRLMISVLDSERPPYRYGTVISINPDARYCMVRFPGGASDGSNDVKVRIGGIQPSATGQTVRVAGLNADYFVSDVVGNALLTTTPTASLPIPTGVVLTAPARQVTLTWNDVSTTANPVSKYEVQFAQSADFLTNPQSYTTVARTLSQPYAAGTTVWARVRSLNGIGGSSAWGVSAPVSILVGDYPVVTDGHVPAIAPQPVISQGIGFLVAQWVPMSNADPLTYEVHVGTTSGFTPSSATFLGQTSSTFYVIDQTPANTSLVYGTTYYVRLIAKDGDGSGPAGPQSFGVPQKVQLGDVGNVPSSAISDGVAPTTSPGAPTIKAGIGFLFAKWTPISNPDQVTYEIHVGTVSTFIPDANSYVSETTADFAFIRTQGAGASYAPLAYGTTYFVKLWAKDQDGYAPSAGAGTSSVTVQANTADIVAGAITAASGIIANLAVGTAQIQDLAISSAKIANLAVGTAQIAALAVTDAKIASLTVDKLLAGNLTVAVALTAGAIRTAASGARVTLDSTGLKAFNSSGTATVQINSDGSASFTGTITGGIFQTATSGARVVITGGTTDTIFMYSGLAQEVTPARLESNISVGRPFVSIFGSAHSTSGGFTPNIQVYGDITPSVLGGNIQVQAGAISLLPWTSQSSTAMVVIKGNVLGPGADPEIDFTPAHGAAALATFMNGVVKITGSGANLMISNITTYTPVVTGLTGVTGLIGRYRYLPNNMMYVEIAISAGLLQASGTGPSFTLPVVNGGQVTGSSFTDQAVSARFSNNNNVYAQILANDSKISVSPSGETGTLFSTGQSYGNLRISALFSVDFTN